MIRTFGKMPDKMPAGFFKAIHFPTLVKVDFTTGDHRRLLADGGGSRDLPLSIRYAIKDSYGHDGAIVSGALFEVTIDPESGNASGKGFLLNDANGREHARLVYTQAMRGNSIDLTEAKARIVEDMASEDWWIEFYEWKVGATTGVAKPAFAGAHATIPDGMTEDELMASLEVDPMEPLVCEFDEFYIHTPADDVEMVASAGTVVPYDDFFIPEADQLTKIVVDKDGRVFGHLGAWNSCHDGYQDRCVMIPRPTDGYASFNKPGVLTEKGIVQTGPIFAYGGHRSAKAAPTIEQAYGGIENAWADVRIIEGRLGPWISGRVRPGVADDTVYAARASRVSGHWVGPNLRGIVSVNVEGFDVKGDPMVEVFASGAHVVMEGDTVELVASLPGCVTDEAEAETGVQLTFTLVGDVDVDALTAAIEAALGQSNTSGTAAGVSVEMTEQADDGVDYDAMLADLLDEDEDDS